MVGTHAPSGCRYLEYLQENRTADRAGWAAGRRGRLGTDCLPTMLCIVTTVRPRKPTQEEAVQEGKVAAEAHLHKEMMARERKNARVGVGP